MSPSKQAASAESAWLGLGSNLGERLDLLRRAVAALGAIPGVQLDSVSSVYASAAVGMPGAPDFLNAAVGLRTTLAPNELLAATQEVERALGRVRRAGPGWQSRTIDIDILLYGEVAIDTDDLKIPHPRLKERPFALVPLAEIAPSARLDGRTIAEWVRLTGAVRPSLSRLAFRLDGL